MGIAVLSGVIDSLDNTLSKFRDDFPKWESHTPGTLTPAQSLDGHPDGCIPSRFLACVSREDTANKLRKIFGDLGQLGSTVEVFASNNGEPVQRADVVLLWCDTLLLLARLSADVRFFTSCKPQVAHAILAERGIKEALDGKLLISILAGITMNQLASWVLPTTRVVRAMPNTPCKVGQVTLTSSLCLTVHLDSRGHDCRFEPSPVRASGNGSCHHPQNILIDWQMPIFGRKTL